MVRLQCSFFIIPLLGLFLQLSDAQFREKSNPSKYSSQIPNLPNRRVQSGPNNYPDINSQLHHHQQQQNEQPDFDFSGGFPKDFMQGLPTFDFSGPMPAASGNGEPGNGEVASDTENLGFVHGPPKGFPSFEEIGGNFPDFGGGSSGGGAYGGGGRPSHPHPHPSQSQSHSQSFPKYRPGSPGPPPMSYQQQSPIPLRNNGPPPKHPHNSYHGPGPLQGSPSNYDQDDDNDDYFGPGGGPKEQHHSPSSGGPPGSSGPSYNRRPPPRGYQPQYPGRPQSSSPGGPGGVSAAGSDSSYVGRPSPQSQSSSHSHQNQQNHLQQPKRPIVLKVSSLKTHQMSELPPGPPVFYAPSPDQKAKQQQQHSASNSIREDSRPQNDHEYPGESEPPHRNGGNGPSQHHNRYRRSIPSSERQKPKSYENMDDMMADGSEDAYWGLSSPFILFDTYKPRGNSGEQQLLPAYQTLSTSPRHASSSTSALSSSNLSFLEPQEGEQRFFPTFPAPAPFLGAAFGPQSRPLFPGPASNRSPSRYHPQFGPSKYNSPVPPPPPVPNRGPSIYSSAESHDRFQDNNLLGSGNFEVVRGGTYYEDDDLGGGNGGGFHGGHGHGYDHDDGPGDYFGHHHNGHTSPQGYTRGIPGGGGDFFSNFRDFADISPPSRSFSHNHETLTDGRHIYSSLETDMKPKNILEKLESSDSAPVYQALSRESLSESMSDPMMATF